MKRISMWVAVGVMTVVLSGCCMFGGKCGSCGGGEKKAAGSKCCAPTEKVK